MSDGPKRHYQNEKNPKDAHFLPSINLTALPSNVKTSEEYSEEPIKTIIKEERASQKSMWLILGATVFAGALLFVIIRSVVSTKASESSIGQHITEAPEEEGIALQSDTVSTKLNPLLTEEAISNGCVIITGTFGEQDNANSMLSNINSHGYKPYESRNKSLLRIGIQFDCLDVNLDSMLTVVRESLSTDAWYLVPRYDPEL